MATQSNGSKSKAQRKKSTTNGAAKRPAATKAAPTEKNQAQVAAEAAVDLPVGVVLTVTDRLSDLVEPWSGRETAEKQIKTYRTQLRRSLKRAERRGTTARARQPPRRARRATASSARPAAASARSRRR